MSNYRIEQDSMGELKVPVDALYGAQTQRAVQNFPISGLRVPRAFILALGRIKAAAARVNFDLGLLDEKRYVAITKAASEVADGDHDDQFPVDIFQTGSGTSSNMNCNEVVAHLASTPDCQVHANDHVNMGQSSNDVIPTAIQVSAVLTTERDLLPALQRLHVVLLQRSAELADVAKTGRTHLMDAMPVTLGQELAAWAAQISSNIARINDTLMRCRRLPQGGTAVGTGINTPPEFGARFASRLSELTGGAFECSDNLFEGISTQDVSVELSGQLRTTAVGLMKISNDLRWMNSGPLAGLGEISLPALQPGSSIMPGKINPVIPEAMAMVCAQVIGNDATITVGGQAGNFQLNTMLPVIAYNLLQSISILGNSVRLLADSAIATFKVNEDRLDAALERNPILVTALNPVIGYEMGVEIAKRADHEGRSIKEVAAEMTGRSTAELDRLLDPLALTRGGIREV